MSTPNVTDAWLISTSNVWRLSPREVETLVFASQGLSHSETAREMGITQETVKNHVHNIRTKSSYSGTLAGLLFQAVHHGLIPMPVQREVQP